jgi:hypothetical protein
MAKSAWLIVVVAGIGWSAAAGELERQVSRTVPLAADGRLMIETEKGSLRVSGWDRPEVEIRARIEDQSYFLRDSEAVRETDVRIDASPGSVRVKSDYSRLRGRGWGVLGLFSFVIESPAVHYTIRMPRTAKLKIKDHRSQTEVWDLKSDLEMETYRGSVEAHGLEGAIQFKSYRGQARFKLAGLTRNSRLETYRGDITLALPRDGGFSLETELGRRAGLSSDFRIPTRIHSRYRNDYRGAVNGGGPKLLVKSERGTVRLRRS